MKALGCTGSIFNVPQAAGNFSQLSGVLAGFAFAIIVFLLTPMQGVPKQSRRKSGRRRKQAPDGGAGPGFEDLFPFLVAALLGLLLSAIGYAVLTGEPFPEARGRAATEELLDGLPLALSVMMLLYGATMLINNGRIRAASWLSRSMVTGLASVVAMFYLFSGISDTDSVRLSAHAATAALCNATPPMPTLGEGLTVALLAVIAIALAMRRERARLSPWLGGMRATLPALVTTASATAMLLSGYVSTRSEGFILSPPWLDIYQVATFFIMSAVTVCMTISE